MAMLLQQRLDTIGELYERLKNGKARSSDVAKLEEVIEAESGSMSRAQAIADTESFKDSYRNGQRVAAENSREVVRLCEEALECMQARDYLAASKFLGEALTHRSKRREAKRGAKSVSALYTEYQAATDTAFHEWLRKNGHRETLAALGVATPPSPARRKTTKRVPGRRGNSPEDYE